MVIVMVFYFILEPALNGFKTGYRIQCLCQNGDFPLPHLHY